MTEAVAVAAEAPVETPATEQAQGAQPVQTPEQQAPEQQTDGNTPEQAEEEHKLPKGVQKRLARLTRERYRLQGELEAIRRQQQPQEPSKSQDATSLKPENFSSYEDYLEARAVERVKRELKQEEERGKQTQAQAKQAELADSWRAKAEEASDTYDDFDEVVYRPEVPITDHMAQALMRLPKGADVAYYLGKNPTIAAKIAAMDPYSAAVEIGQLAATVARPQPKKQTSAPPPITPVGSQSAPAKDPEKMSTKEWMEWRNAQVAAKRKR